MDKPIKDMDNNELALEALRVSVGIVNFIHRECTHEGAMVEKALISKEDLYRLHILMVQCNEEVFGYLKRLQARQDELKTQKETESEGVAQE